MLILFTWASIALTVSSTAASTPSACDTIKSSDQDTVRAQDSELVRKSSLLRERPSMGTSPSLDNRFGPHLDQQEFAGAVHSLIGTHPGLRSLLLREILIPPILPGEFQVKSPLETFNEQLARDSRFTPFERMSLIAKRYAVYNPSDRSLKSYQLDIRRTIAWWLEEVLK